MTPLGGEVVERPPRVREVTGSIPGWVIPKTIKMVVIAALLCAEGSGVSINRSVVLFIYPGNAMI